MRKSLSKKEKSQPKDCPQEEENEYVEIQRIKPPKNLKKTKMKEKEQGKSSTYTRTSDIKCFKCLDRGHKSFLCPNKRVIILRSKDLYNSQDESSSSSVFSKEEGPRPKTSYAISAYLCFRELLLTITSNKLGSTHRENIFQITG